MIDLVADNMDLAIRVGWLADSGLQARRIGAFRQLLVGRHDFADRIADLKELPELASLPFIANTALREPLTWTFSRANTEQYTLHFKAVMSINTTPAVLEAVRHGGGLSVLPDFLVAEELKNGQLFQAFPEWHLPSGGVHTVYPAARFRAPKVSAFVDMPPHNCCSLATILLKARVTAPYFLVHKNFHPKEYAPFQTDLFSTNSLIRYCHIVDIK